jgi:hypothetical protein
MFDRPAAIAARLKALLACAGALLAGWLLLQATLFRSGAYWHLAEPDSHAGAVTHALAVLESTPPRAGRRTVLVLGDSRVGEGFSGPRASAGGDVDFVNLSVPGSTPRTWYYLLREIDRRGVHYDAVVLGMLYVSTDRALSRDWPFDPLHQVALVGPGDLARYPHETSEGAARARAWQAVLLPGLIAQQDARDLLLAPWRRLRHLRGRAQYVHDSIHYAGSDVRLPDIDIDAAAMADARIATAPAIARENAAYRAHWVRRIGERAAARGAPLITFALPRGPYTELLPERATPDWPMADELPADLLADLEAPQYFFDRLHLNRAGRDRLSALVGERVRARLAAHAGAHARADDRASHGNGAH